MYNQDPLEYYKILNVTPDTDEKTLKLNYRDEAKKWHPDYNKSEEAMERFQKISVAYDILHDEKKRLVYDLLACAYDKDEFPQMDSLSILKDRMEAENPEVRVLCLHYVVGKFLKHSVKKERLICSEPQAFNEILKCSLTNWCLGWWNPKAFVENLKAIKYNFSHTTHNRRDNLSLLVHNAIAYRQEGKEKQALASMTQALEYALPEQQKYLEKFIGGQKIRVPHWRWFRLKLAHFVVPFVFGLMILSPILSSSINNLSRYMTKQNEITYFQKVKFSSGEETFDDIVVSKIFDIPVDIFDNKMLFHVVEDTNVMYGPGNKFDVMNKLKAGHTVRVTGFTPDKKWYRVMLDNGDMGFVQKIELEKGIKNKIPDLSKIVP